MKNKKLHKTRSDINNMRKAIKIIGIILIISSSILVSGCEKDNSDSDKKEIILFEIINPSDGDTLITNIEIDITIEIIEGKVNATDYFFDSVLIGTGTSIPFSLSWTPLNIPSSDHEISVTCYGNNIDATNKINIYIRNPIDDPLVFSNLLKMMGKDVDQVRNSIPGKLLKEETDLGELQLWYFMKPVNVDIKDTLIVLYEFLSEKLNEISLLAVNEKNQLNLAYNIMNCAVNDIDESDQYFLVYESDSYNQYEYFTSCDELWDFIKIKDLYSGNIIGLGAEWYYNEWILTIGYLGDYTDLFIAFIDENSGQKSDLNFNRLKEFLSGRLQ